MFEAESFFFFFSQMQKEDWTYVNDITFLTKTYLVVE